MEEREEMENFIDYIIGGKNEMQRIAMWKMLYNSKI